MSLGLHRMISLLTEHSDPIMDNQTYNDLIHGRSQQIENLSQEDFGDVPIKLANPKWNVIATDDGEMLSRSFEFLNFQTLFYFVAESLKLQDRLNHHCTMIIDELSVLIRMQTKDLNEVTELDLELSEKIYDIYEDTQYFHSVSGAR